MLLDTYAPLERIKTKPWITLLWLKKISISEKLLKSFITKKDPSLKEEFYTTQ